MWKQKKMGVFFIIILDREHGGRSSPPDLYKSIAYIAQRQWTSQAISATSSGIARPGDHNKTPDSRQLLKLLCVEEMSFHSLLNLSKLHIYNIFGHPKWSVVLKKYAAVQNVVVYNSKAWSKNSHKLQIAILTGLDKSYIWWQYPPTSRGVFLQKNLNWGY